MTTGDVVYSLRFSLIKILPEPGFDLGSTAGESCVLTARLHMLDNNFSFHIILCPDHHIPSYVSNVPNDIAINIIEIITTAAIPVPTAIPFAC